MNKYYITNAIPYVNAVPHIGHALEFIQSDTIARYHKLLGKDVMYVCGSDENALKNAQVAETEDIPVQELVDKYASAFSDVARKLNVEFDIFQKTSDQEKHYPASQKLWELCAKNGDIYKKSYKGLYCVGCEEFKSSEDLNEHGECPEHPGKKLQEVEEENYFFKLSKYQDQLLNIIKSNEYEIVPEFRKNEIVSFIKSGLQDFSISRSNERAKNWGIPVPGDPSQRIYVWFDALNVYQSAIGFGWDEETYKKWWPADLHVIGKGIIRFHAVYWPAILLSAGLSLPKKLFVHEYFTVDGQKMSKTLGNVINPVDLIGKYGADAVRYYCLAKFSPFSDGDFSEERLKEVFNSDLANGLGNLIARVAKLAQNNEVTITTQSEHIFFPEVLSALDEFKFHVALESIWKEITELDRMLNDIKPWTLSKEEATPVLTNMIHQIQRIAYNLKPFMPEIAGKIEKQFTGREIITQSSLFPRM
jgi:methionyl-tRNA synthetase